MPGEPPAYVSVKREMLAVVIRLAEEARPRSESEQQAIKAVKASLVWKSKN